MNDMSNMAVIAQSGEKISALLKEEHRSLQGLMAVLEEENRTINGHDLARLEEITLRKQKLIAQVEKVSRNRMHFLQQLGIDPNKNDWSQQLQQMSGQNSVVEQPLRQLVELTRQCRGLNRTNGLALNHKQQLTTRLMGVLRDSNNSETYSDRAMSESSGEHRIIGKA